MLQSRDGYQILNWGTVTFLRSHSHSHSVHVSFIINESSSSFYRPNKLLIGFLINLRLLPLLMLYEPPSADNDS